MVDACLKMGWMVSVLDLFSTNWSTPQLSHVQFKLAAIIIILQMSWAQHQIHVCYASFGFCGSGVIHHSALPVTKKCQRPPLKPGAPCRNFTTGCWGIWAQLFCQEMIPDGAMFVGSFSLPCLTKSHSELSAPTKQFWILMPQNVNTIKRSTPVKNLHGAVECMCKDWCCLANGWSSAGNDLLLQEGC